VSDDVVRLAKTVVGGEQIQAGQAPARAATKGKQGGLFQWRAH
jgi:hypothetical protein